MRSARRPADPSALVPLAMAHSSVQATAAPAQQLRGDVDVFAAGFLRGGRRRLAASRFSRTPASLISIGRLTPAITSTLARSSTEMARLDGVPPNMSVSSTTPSPLVDLGHGVEDLLAALLHVVLGADADGRDALLRARPHARAPRRTPAARRPWVTRTIPIMIEPWPPSFRRGVGSPAAGGLSLRDVAAVFPARSISRWRRSTPRPCPLSQARQAFGHEDRAVACRRCSRPRWSDSSCPRGHSAAAAAPASPSGSEERREVGIGLDEVGDRRVAPGHGAAASRRNADCAGSARRTPGRPRAAGPRGRRRTSPTAPPASVRPQSDRAASA